MPVRLRLISKRTTSARGVGRSTTVMGWPTARSVPEALATLVAMADGPQAPTSAGAVPWRTIVASVAVVVGTLGAFLLLRELSRILAWLAVAAFFTVVLAPAVDGVQH